MKVPAENIAAKLYGLRRAKRKKRKDNKRDHTK
jgi:hypothetical protein